MTDWKKEDWEDRGWTTCILIRVHKGRQSKRDLLGWNKKLPFAESRRVQEVFECLSGIRNVKLRLLTGHSMPKDATPLDTATRTLVGTSGVKLPPETFRKLFVKTHLVKPDGEVHEVYLVANITEATWATLQRHHKSENKELVVVSREELRESFRGEKDPIFDRDQADALQEHNVILFLGDDIHAAA